MKYKLLLVLFLSQMALLFSKNKYSKSEDSLYVLIKNEKQSTKKINYYKELCAIYKKYSLLKFDRCNEQLGQIIQKSKAVNQLGFYYNNKAIICTDNNEFKQALEYAARANDCFLINKDWHNYILSSCEYAMYLILNEEQAKAKKVLYNTLNLAINYAVPIFQTEISTI